MEQASLPAALQELPVAFAACDYASRGFHYEGELTDSAQLEPLAQAMLKEGFYLVSVTAVHAAPAIEMVYQFAHFRMRCRIVARAAVEADNALPTISHIYPGANWHEREMHDMYGVVFQGHPYLEPLLLPEEDAGTTPLLKAQAKVKEVGALRFQPPAAAEKEESNASTAQSKQGESS